MKVLYFTALLCCAVLMSAGCTTSTVERDIEFDSSGWGGPNLNYTHDANAKLLSVKSGVLVNKAFRWSGSKISFEFLDRSDLAWGFVLTDLQFRAERRRALDQTWVKIAPKEFKKGRDVSAEQLWVLDRVAEVKFLKEAGGRGYKAFAGWSFSRIGAEGKDAVRVGARHDAGIKRSAWNKITISITGGKLTYTLNGRQGAGGMQIDPRTNGRFGIFVLKDGPLQIRNLQQTGAVPAT
jgi:hypothetical protein